ncbi:MAG: Zn-ribbon domain-containing OB-fold protein [Thermodesulfobacteriota bacterium]|jgi:uncharacterized OB-fold protein
MSEYKKPLPVVQPWSKPFWEAAKRHRLMIQRCNDCGLKIFYPRKYCPDCWSANLDWFEASGRGKVFSYSITMAGVEERFAEDLPFVLALVDLEEGIRMMTNIVECKPDEVSIGMDVKVTFRDVTDEFSLPMFKLNPKK